MKSSMSKERIIELSAIALRRALVRIQKRKLDSETEAKPSDKKDKEANDQIRTYEGGINISLD